MSIILTSKILQGLCREHGDFGNPSDYQEEMTLVSIEEGQEAQASYTGKPAVGAEQIP